ncbi:DUF3885 domain-containing protein [Streptomyces mexicanus]|uniref:DUF3885 domain-containing protein n=1 Tax=Streptomyces mexicanus TaxID=178566 RepID=UPI003CD0AA08
MAAWLHRRAAPRHRRRQGGGRPHHRHPYARIHHPYDGGADVFLAPSEERDRVRDRHADWLSRHPSGL